MEHRHLAYRAGLVCLMGGGIQILFGLLAILFPYPRVLDARLDFLFLLANVGMIGGFVGLLALDAGRPRPLALAGGALGIIGHTIRIVLSAMLMRRPVLPGENAIVDAAFLACILLMYLGMGMLGVATLRGKRITGWRAWAPLLTLATGFIAGATFSFDVYLGNILAGLLWGAAWLLLASVVLRHASGRTQVAQPPSPRATATP
jgi:hypothetical protein